MTANILDGTFVATQIRQKIHKTVAKRLQSGQRAPGLAVILIGDDPASSIYVNGKRRACVAAGFHSIIHHLPANTAEKQLISLIDELNNDPCIDGILVQLPLPAAIHTPNIIERIRPDKDVDGFHPYNLGRLAQGNPLIRPCTPYGIMTLLEHYAISMHGQHAVVVGASNIVGRPMALELLRAKATVTICHSATQHLEQHIRSASLIIAATGVPDLIQPSWLQKNQILVDVGMHRTTPGKLRGDIDFLNAQNHVAWITPVPGGVGPMTITMLLQNTLDAAAQHGN